MAEKNRKDNPQEQEQDLSQILQVRRDKLAALQKEGKDPFQQTKFTVSAHTQQIKDHFDQMEGQAVTVAGVSCQAGHRQSEICRTKPAASSSTPGGMRWTRRCTTPSKSTTSATWWGWKARSSGPSGGR